MDKKDDYYITFLKYARDKMVVGDGTVDYDDVFEHVHSIHGDVSEHAFKRTFLQAVVTVLFQGRAAHYDDIDSGTPLVLTLEAYFQLLEHEELEQARTSSTKALRVATRALWAAFGAMVITVAVALASFIVPMFEPTAVEIDPTQIADIKAFIESQDR